MPQDHEFRCFVSNHKIQGISQYHCYTKFPSLQDRDHILHIRDVIVKFHELAKTSLVMPNYVMDVAVLPDSSCYLIEVNPFGPYMSSGAALFNWEKDGDLLYGKKESKDGLPEIRILQQLLD